jgi:hypothetical protein
MSELSYRQEVELLEAMLEALTENHHDYETIVNEVIDSIMPIYYTDIVNEWTEAGMPQPDDETGTIFDQMTFALWECYSNFAYNIVSEATVTPSATELVRQALGVRKGYADLAQAIIR